MFEVDKNVNGLILTELAEGVTVADVLNATGCEFQVKHILNFKEN